MAFKMKGFTPFTKNGDGKGLRKMTDSEKTRNEKIKRNTEFNRIAEEKGVLPKFNSSEEKEAWYSSKANVNKLNKAQADYFKNK